jgi:hypothetical protein
MFEKYGIRQNIILWLHKIHTYNIEILKYHFLFLAKINNCCTCFLEKKKTNPRENL